jgi:hypothetical protein
MAGERVRVVLERSGGVVGRSLRRGLDTDALPDDTAARLRELAADLVTGRVTPSRGPGSKPPESQAPETPESQAPGSAAAPRSAARASGPDRFAYTLKVDGPHGRTVRTFSEPVPDDVRPLVDLMRTAPLLPARRGPR